MCHVHVYARTYVVTFLYTFGSVYPKEYRKDIDYVSRNLF